ncbi:hypothetical protein [Bacteroides sp. UBA939]|uniref:hypothetical protein n=1 Tax=Bacteroides sp. UBA939 TaxID=1946092 RepID=UPI0025B80E90|nr:hypothetical protein [Bacteroides sp. UBA939]
MIEQNDIERYCRNCISRDFVNGRGLVCKRTGSAPAFQGECESYQKDEELEKMAPTPNPEDYSGYVDREQLLAKENLPKAVLLGALACIVGAVAWALISISTGYQIGYMAIGVGFLVGIAMRQGKGIRPIFGIIGAALALLSCIMGDFFSIIGWAADENEISFMEALLHADYGVIKSLMVENMASMTIVFYGIALYEGYKLSFSAQKAPEGGNI